MALNFAAEVFQTPGMNQPSRVVTDTGSVSLAEVQIQLLPTAKTKARARRLLAKHHYLGDVQAVGEQLFYAITAAAGGGLGVLVFCAASRRLRARDRWIGWTEEQRRRRLPLVVNNCRFLLLPDKTFPNLGSRSLRLALDRLSADWQARYGHPVVLVETFVDPEQFCGTVYTANGWQELGQTDGFGRVRRDFYVEHHKPKRLFARELCRNARRSLAADKLKPALAGVEAKTRPRSTHHPTQIRSLVEPLKNAARLRAHRHLSAVESGRPLRAGSSVWRAARPEGLGRLRQRPQPGATTRLGDSPAGRRNFSLTQPADLLPDDGAYGRQRTGKDLPPGAATNPRTGAQG